MRTQSLSQQRGFTLIELMVVIVIVSILASLIVMNLSGVDQRKAMQAREVLIMDLKRMSRESTDQSRIYALVTQAETNVSPFQYYFEEYQNPLSIENSSSTILLSPSNQNDQKKTWVEIEGLKKNTLDAHISFTVEAQTYEFKGAHNSDLLGTRAPALIWLGNGEAKPVNIQMYYDQKAVGGLIQVDYLGKVSESS